MRKFMEGRVAVLTVLEVFENNRHYAKCMMMHHGRPVSIRVWVYEPLQEERWFKARFDGEMESDTFCVEKLEVDEPLTAPVGS